MTLTMTRMDLHPVLVNLEAYEAHVPVILPAAS